MTRYDTQILWLCAVILLLASCWAIRVPYMPKAEATLQDFAVGRHK